MVALEDDLELFEKIDPADYTHRSERMMVLDLQAFDWNCTQHITPRYTVEDVEAAFASQNEYVSKLEAEILKLKKGLIILSDPKYGSLQSLCC